MVARAWRILAMQSLVLVREVEGMTKRIVSDQSKSPFDPAARKALLEERATESAKAMSEYKAAVEAERAKTERLRALRLAKEAASKKKES
jgi:hypothetical protein